MFTLLVRLAGREAHTFPLQYKRVSFPTDSNGLVHLYPIRVAYANVSLELELPKPRAESATQAQRQIYAQRVCKPHPAAPEE